MKKKEEGSVINKGSYYNLKCRIVKDEKKNKTLKREKKNVVKETKKVESHKICMKEVLSYYM